MGRSATGLGRLSLVGLLAAVAATAARGGDGEGDAEAAAEFFEKTIRPLLAERCVACHGPAKQKGGLRLDSRAAALAGGGTGPAVVPGDAAKSLLVDAVNYGDLYRMPPKSKLPDAEIAALTRWVAGGAHWPDASGPRSGGGPRRFDLAERARHWSFQPVRDPAPPAVADAAWPANPVDRFLLARLESEGLKPAPDADRRTLIRRVTFDLTGLPPAPVEVDAFLADGSPDAFETVVDRLLASPHYGERWARHWLDLVRYAESSGHEFDYNIPNAYRYRDYVIRALNADVPFDAFAVEHLAGDLLGSPRRDPATGLNESVAATGVFLLGDGNHSPVDLREEQARRVDDQIDVVSKAFLGLTVSCARCHDHKFDAIATRDYYALFGYLKSSRHQQAFLDPPSRLAAPLAELAAIRAGLAGPRGEGVASPRPLADGAILFEDFDGPSYEGWTVTGDAFGPGPTRPGDVRVAGGAASRLAPGVAHSGAASDRLQGVLRSATFPIVKKFVHYRASGRGGRIHVIVDGFDKIRDPIYGPLVLNVESASPRWFTQDLSMWPGHDAYIEVADGAVLDYTTGNVHVRDGGGFIAVDAVVFSDRREPPSWPEPPAAAPVAPGPETPASLARYAEVESTLGPPTFAPAILDGTGSDEPVHVRGSSKVMGEVVPRRFLEAIAGAEQASPGEGSGRLELARRVVDPGNPLTARVLVNRLWKHHFGEGLVRSVDDFGAMGQAPSHPELLDWLATRFVRGGWSSKAMHKTLLLSHAYRMGSDARAEADRVDPTNRLLHRMNARRLEAEAIRDAMLAASGRLDPAMFGPSVPVHLTPFMDGRGRPARSGPVDGDGRRSLYLEVRRNFLAPMLLAFDAPAPASPMGRRNASNVPAQSLTLWNDPFVVGQARAWAGRVLAAKGPSREARVSDLYRTAFARPPVAEERAAAVAFLDDAGDTPGAWADLCHVLFHSAEFLYIR